MKKWLDKYNDDIPQAQVGKMLAPITGDDVAKFFDMFSVPQKAVTKLVTGKYQTPSEAMDIKNPVGAFATDMILDPINLMGAGIAGKAAKASTKSGALSKAYKYNPWAFKANPESAYRMIGNEGYVDALKSGVIRPPVGSFHTEAYYNKGYPLDIRTRELTGRAGYEGPYMAEVKGMPESFVNENVANYTGPMFDDPVVYSKEPISIYNPNVKFYKENWLKGYKEVPKTKKKAQNGIEGTMGGLTDQGFNYNGAWGGTMQMGGAMPGAVGFTYARTGSIPSNGPYAKKTKASAQNGGEMKFYQEGLDWKPRNISRNGSEIPVDPMGYWNPDNVGEPVIIPSNEITMEGVYQPLLGISDTGDTQMMYPGEDYEFDGESVTEYPIAQTGKKVSAPTTADSLKVYNAAIKLTDYYKNDKRHNAPLMNLYSGTVEQSRIDDVGRQNLNMYRDMYKLLADPGFKYEGSREELDYGLSRQELLKKVGQAIAESKSASPGTAYYKDAFPSKIDVNAPSAYIDSRISPQGFMYLNSTVPKNKRGVASAPEPAGSITGAWYYDPIAIKPVAMRTPQEQKEFNKKYGNLTPAIVSKPKPKPKPKQEPKKEPKKEQPKPTPTIVERKQNVYEGSPVYSGTIGSGGPSALVGFTNQKGDTTYIKPEDYERFGVPKYGKEFIQNRKKQRNGGVNSADAQPIEKLDQLLNFTNYNKPTKGGWLDKYQ